MKQYEKGTRKWGKARVKREKQNLRQICKSQPLNVSVLKTAAKHFFGSVHTYSDIFKSITFSFRIRFPSTHTSKECVVLENIHTPPTEGFLHQTSQPPPPPGNSIFVSYFRSKNWAFETRSPLEFQLIFLGVGMDIFLQLDNVEIF